MKLKSWLRLFRAQTAPATILCILIPYAAGRSIWSFEVVILGILALFIHYFSFGHNSLMDTAMGYDKRDPSKKHHPLVLGVIKLHEAHSVIHWGLCILTAAAGILTLWISPNPAYAILCLLLWVAFGHGYNDGLSKESLFGFLPISICCTAAAAWGWFLSHASIDVIGFLYLTYTFFTILFQISWSGHLKELEIRERSNILVKMGAKVDVTWRGEKVFIPGKSWIYAWLVKGINVFLGWLLMFLKFKLVTLVIWVILAAIIIIYLCRLTEQRKYVRSKELFNMSIMEIATIYLPIPILLPWLEASILMLTGILYFFIINKVLWDVPYPKV